MTVHLKVSLPHSILAQQGDLDEMGSAVSRKACKLKRRALTERVQVQVADLPTSHKRADEAMPTRDAPRLVSFKVIRFKQRADGMKTKAENRIKP